MQLPFCSVIVLNFQGEKIVGKTIESLLALDYPKDSYEIIIVDNASTDGSRNIINNITQNSNVKSQIDIPNIKSVFLEKNLGFSAGNNAGIKIAKGKYVVLLNNDCTVDTQWLKELVTTAEKNKSIFAVNSKIMLGGTNKIQNAGIRIFPNGYARDIGAIPKDNKQDYELDKGQYNTEAEVDAACAAAALYRKSVLDKIGWLDEDFFMYYEDVELSQRARKKGYKIIYCPRATAYHEHAASSREWSPFFIYHSERGRLMHLFLHFPFSIFVKEYLVFKMKAKLRLLVRLFTKPSSIKVNWQYIRVSWYILMHMPLLLSKRKKM